MALLMLAPLARTQEWVRWGRNWLTEVSTYSRNELGNGAGEVLTRIDSKEHAGWGTWFPTFRTVYGVQFAAVRGPTAQTINIKFYPEGTPDMPNLGSGVAFATSVPIPAGLPSCITVTAGPVLIPITASGDIFLSFELPATPIAGWPTDGIGIGIVTGYPGLSTNDFAWPVGPLTNFDKPGDNCLTLSVTAAGTYGMKRPPNGAATYVKARQHWFDLKHRSQGTGDTAGGVGITANNQPSYPSGAFGTSTFFSGSSPHVNFGTLNGNPANRCDSIGMGITMNNLALGHVVVWAIQPVGTFGSEVPITFPPGSTGVVCLDPIWSAQWIMLASMPIGNTLEMLFPVPWNTNLTGIPIVQQAFAVHTTGRIHSSPCDRMVL